MKHKQSMEDNNRRFVPHILNGISHLVSQMNWDVSLQKRVSSPKATIEDNIRSLEYDRHLVMGHMPPL